MSLEIPVNSVFLEKRVPKAEKGQKECHLAVRLVPVVRRDVRVNLVLVFKEILVDKVSWDSLVQEVTE